MENSAQNAMTSGPLGGKSDPRSVVSKFTDEKLYELCRKYGTTSLLWRQKFIGLLPEVNRRRLYERKDFLTVFDFAFKLCGLSIDQVNLTLNLGRRFEDMPALKKMLEEGEVSINKLARIVSIATPDNEEELAEKARILPKSALETLVRDEKFAMKDSANDGCGNTVDLFGEEIGTNATISANLFGEIKNQNGLFEPLLGGGSLPGQTLKSGNQRSGNVDGRLCGQTSPCGQTFPLAKHSLTFGTDGRINSGGLSFKLADDVKKELEELNSKGIDVNELLRKALKQRKEEIEKRKEEIAKELENVKERNDARALTKDRRATDQSEKSASPGNVQPASRYIPVKVKEVIKEEHGTKCSILTCQKPAEVLHHTQTFGLSHTHDPRFLAPLCKEHHMIAHSMDVKFHEMRNMRSA